MINLIESKNTLKPSDIKILLGRLELAVKGSGFAVWEFELKTGKLLWDKKMHSIYGFELGKFDSDPQTWKSCIHPEDRQIVDQKFESLMQGNYVEIFEFRILHHTTKEIRYIEANGALETDHAGQPYRLVGMNRDITDRKIIEINLEDERVARINDSKMAALGEMASGIAHEINNPLTVINILAIKVRTLLEKDNILSPQVSNELDLIHETTKRMAKIIRGLQNFSRNSQLDQLEPIPIQNIIHDTLELCNVRFQNTKIELKIKMPEEPIFVLSRPAELSQVILNLINNSVYAIQNLTNQWIEIFVCVSGETVEIRITDSGTGISKEVQSKMMQPFYTSKPIGQGTGLGLSISRSIINNHDGQFFYDDFASHTCFVIQLKRI